MELGLEGIERGMTFLTEPVVIAALGILVVTVLTFNFECLSPFSERVDTA